MKKYLLICFINFNKATEKEKESSNISNNTIRWNFTDLENSNRIHLKFKTKLLKNFISTQKIFHEYSFFSPFITK